MPVEKQKFQGKISNFPLSGLIDSFSMPRFFGHYQAKECYNPREISFYSVAVDLLNGAHGKFLSRKDPGTKSSHFIRKKIHVAMTYSQTIPTPSVTQHQFLNLFGSSYYVPYVMFEQLHVRPSDYTFIEKGTTKLRHNISIQFDLIDNWRMSSLQDRWLSYMDYICGEVVPSIDSKLFSEGNLVQRIVFFISIQAAILQLLANVIGSLLSFRVTPLLLPYTRFFKRTSNKKSPTFLHC